MFSHSLSKQACFIILAVGLSLSMAHPGTADESVPPLQKRDLSKAIRCPGHLKPLDCNKYKRDYSLVTCPDGDMTFGGMGVTDDSFQVWCGTSAQGRHAKSVTCPENSVARAGVAYMSNVWTLRCERDYTDEHGYERAKLHGPFFKWYTSDGKLQSITSGHFDSDRPIGYWLVESGVGNLIDAGKMVFSHGSVYNSEKDGEWLQWKWDSGTWQRLYYIKGEGPWYHWQEYLQELKRRAKKPK